MDLAGSTRTCDVVIVGAGSAGCVLAARLSEDSERKVLLIEAGPDYPDLATLPVPSNIRARNLTTIMIAEHMAKRIAGPAVSSHTAGEDNF